MNTIGIDIETKSGVDVVNTGVYRYVESSEFAIILFAYKINNDPVKIIDLYKDKFPEEIIKILTDPAWIKTAHNANFERTCINKFFKINSPVWQWDCTQVRVALLTLPLSLDACSAVLKTALKDKRGKALITLFSKKMFTPEKKPEEWNDFKNYCVQDVISEQDIKHKVSVFSIPDFERTLWILDQDINDYGVEVDVDFINKCLIGEKIYTAKLIEQAKQLTGLENPNSVAQIKKWIFEKTGEKVRSLSKGNTFYTDDPDVNNMLDIRDELSKTSVKKYQAMKQGVCADNRIRGLLQYYGANRTGRWAGRLVQVQNLPRNSMSDLDLARKLVKTNDFELLEIIFGDVNYVLSQLIRTAFIPKKNHRFIISDFSAIEARVVAWVCNEKWRLNVFKTHGKIYEASAAMMFNVPIESVTKGSDLRTRGKIAELALGYGGAVGALERMGAAQMGLTSDQMLKLVKLWRKTSPNIKNFWYNIENIVKQVIETREPRNISCLRVYIKNGTLFIDLPSARRLAYIKPEITDNGICYMGVDQTTKQWSRTYTYGGKLTENIVQAIARDCLADAMIRLHNKGYKIVMHVHDEVILEVPDINKDFKSEVDKIMSMEITWAKGLPLKAESFESYYYKKE
jgi:DNA polymerase